MRLFAGVALVFAALLLPGPVAAQALQRFVFVRPQMGVQVNIVILASDSAHAATGAEAAFVRIDTLNAKLSDYLSNSELARLSGAAGGGRPVRVSDDLWFVLVQAQRFAKDTGGLFDPTVGPLTRLWRWAARRNTLPPQSEIDAARSRVDFRLMVLDHSAQTVQLARHGMRLDLGGIAKGYAADKALTVLREEGLVYAVVDVGGDIAVGEVPEDSTGWTVEIGPAGRVQLAGCGIAASGSTYRYTEQDGVKYSHILDPRTGMGLTHRRTVTVIAPSATEADALASAASVMAADELRRFGEKKGISLCKEESVARCLKACGDSAPGIIEWQESVVGNAGW